MQNKNYREHLKEAVSFLYFAEDTIYGRVVNLAFSGIYREIAQVHAENEIVEMDPAYFEDTDDANVEMLMNLMKRIRLTRQKIMNLNAMEEDEVFDDSYSSIFPGNLERYRGFLYGVLLESYHPGLAMALQNIYLLFQYL